MDVFGVERGEDGAEPVGGGGGELVDAEGFEEWVGHGFFCVGGRRCSLKIDSLTLEMMGIIRSFSGDMK